MDQTCLSVQNRPGQNLCNWAIRGMQGLFPFASGSPEQIVEGSRGDVIAGRAVRLALCDFRAGPVADRIDFVQI